MQKTTQDLVLCMFELISDIKHMETQRLKRRYVKGIFLELEERKYFTIDQFNFDLHAALYNLNHSLLKNHDYSRSDTWEEEKHELTVAAAFNAKRPFANASTTARRRKLHPDFGGAIHSDATGSLRPPYSDDGWYERIGSEDNPLSDSIMDRIKYDAYKISIQAVDAKHDKSMREIYGLKASESC